MKHKFTNEDQLIYFNDRRPIGTGGFSDVILVAHVLDP